MSVANAGPILGRTLAGWCVLPGGMQVRLDLEAGDGEIRAIVLPFDALTSLLLTLPRMLQTALDERFADGSLRIVQNLGNWRLERAEGEGGLILRLGTRDGFEVAFALNLRDADALGAALIDAPDDIIEPGTRRPH